MSKPSQSASVLPINHDAIIAAPFGSIGVRCAGDTIEEIAYLPARPEKAPCTALAREAAAQLRAYIADPDQVFDLPLADRGTAFQRRVWQAIAAIPLGRTRSYGELAGELGSAARAVGQACGANPFPIVIACHRVVAASAVFNGGLGGFAHARGGFLIEVKRWLLGHEGALRG
jgi:methylated-DNA-[protein]-cysteine S-methyltransferase